MSAYTNKLSLEKLLDKLKADDRFMRNVTAWKELPAVSASFSPFPQWIHPQLATTLTEQGIAELYSHQSQAIELVHNENHVVIVTPTASGKTLCYNLPVLQKTLEEKQTRALYLFPTKALAQDQMKECQRLTTAIGVGIKVHTYDGDTPSDARATIRKQANIVITNPDMLHAAILPHHTKWYSFFANLKYIVIDELHIYRGIFGSHFSNVIQRLLRICRFYGQEPIFICCSATIANPQEHAQNLLKKQVVLVDKNGAPAANKVFILYNPPVVNEEIGIRQSALVPTRSLVSRLIDNGTQTIVFTTSRLNVEILTKYLRDKLTAKNPHADTNEIAGYRGGYLPAMRREIEEGLRSKKIMGVVSTNALELGIDIGNLDACVICGYPGSIASTWQQAGRVGRKKTKSMALLIARSNPMDQFIVDNPEYFFSSPPEHCRINPDNLLVLLSHIKSAAFELPFETNEKFGDKDIADFLSYLEDKGILHRSTQQWHWASGSYPASEIDLRCINPDNVVIMEMLDEGQSRAIAEIDWDSAFTTIYEDAIYMLDAQSYHVEKLDIEGKRAYLKKVDADYYTEAITYKNIRVIDHIESKYSKNIRIQYGEVQVLKNVVSYKKIKFYTLENMGNGDITMPEIDMHTTSYWFTPSRETLNALPYSRNEIIDGLNGLAYALRHVAAMFLMSEINDIDIVIGDIDGEWFVKQGGSGGSKIASLSAENSPIVNSENFEPTIFLFDNYPGGIGFSDLLFKKHDELLKTAQKIIKNCPCKHGCPSCVGPTLESGFAAKEVSLKIIAMFG